MAEPRKADQGVVARYSDPTTCPVCDKNELIVIGYWKWDRLAEIFLFCSHCTAKQELEEL